MLTKNLKTAVFFCLIFIFCSCSKKDSTTPTTNGPYFATVKTIIQNNCLACHSSTGSWAGRPVAFDTDDAIASQAAAIKAAVNDPETATNRRMPQSGSLTTDQISTIVNWYNKGGKVTD